MSKDIEKKIKERQAKFDELQGTLKKNLEIRQQADANIMLLQAQLQELNGAINALKELTEQKEEDVESND